MGTNILLIGIILIALAAVLGLAVSVGIVLLIIFLVKKNKKN